ncbi:MAG: hypothetical protein JWO36_347 [Myxococcales bacterium]|nr:hypothetical protein [Myxococcales bacterium]
MHAYELDPDRPSTLGLVASAGGLGAVFGGFVLQTAGTFLVPRSVGARAHDAPASFVPISAHVGFLFVMLGMLFGALIASRLTRPK